MTADLRDEGDRVVLTITANTRPFTEAMARVATQFEEFLESVLANPLALAAFIRAQKQPLPLLAGRGDEYRRRTRTRTRSRR